MTDQDIIKEVRNGRKAEFRHLIKRCNQPLFRTALAILKNESDAEDAVQTAYMKAFLHLDSFKGESSFQTWITRILINECKMMLRSRRPVGSIENMIENETQQARVEMENPDSKEVRKWIEAAVIELPEKYRLVYMLRELNEYSTEEVMTILSLSEENVKVRLHRAKSLIRDTLLRKVKKTELFEFGNQRCERLTERVMISLGSLQAEN